MGGNGRKLGEGMVRERSDDAGRRGRRGAKRDALPDAHSQARCLGHADRLDQPRMSAKGAKRPRLLPQEAWGLRRKGWGERGSADGRATGERARLAATPDGKVVSNSEGPTPSRPLVRPLQGLCGRPRVADFLRRGLSAARFLTPFGGTPAGFKVGWADTRGLCGG
jgi:hypothetical protein